MPSNMIVKLLIILACVGIDHTHGYKTGAPTKQCTDMTPGHGTSESSQATPYTVSVGSVTTYTPGVKIPVTITGTFKGLLMQARVVSKTAPVGKFTDEPTGTKTIKCDKNGDSFTHSSEADKTGIKVNWQPPNQKDIGNIEIVATIVQTKPTWWKNQKSVQLSYKAPVGSTTTTITTTSETTTTGSSAEIVLVSLLMLALSLIYATMVAI